MADLPPDLVEQIAAAVAAKLGAGAGGAPAPRAREQLTWLQLWSAYEPREVEKLEAPATQRSMAKHLLRLLGPRPVGDIGTEQVSAYRTLRRSEITVRRRPPSDKTINNEIILIRRLTKWAANQRPPLLERDPLAGAAVGDLFVPIQNVRLNVVEDDPAARLSLSAFLDRAGALDRAIILVAHSSGMRRREIAVLEMDWIDRGQRLIHIPPGISKGRRGEKRGRTTIVSDEAIDAVDRYRIALPPRVFHSRWVFPNPVTERHYHPDFFTRRFHRLEQRVGTDGPSGATWLHDLRRSFITLARRRGEDAIRVMKLVGHTTLESQERYHVDSTEEVIGSRDRIEKARAEELERRRRGPRAVPNVQGCGTDNPKTKNG